MQFAQVDPAIAEQLQNASAVVEGLSGYLGFRHTEFTAGRLVVEMDARADLLTAFGNLLGGCPTAMVDHCLGVVFYPVIPAGSWVATTGFQAEPACARVTPRVRRRGRDHRAGKA